MRPTLVFTAVVMLPLLAGCAASVDPPREVAAGDGWRTASPESAGMDRARLDALTAAIRERRANVHAVLIERDGRLVYEQYFTGTDERWGDVLPGEIAFDRRTKHDLRSVSKSVTSALLGIALAGDTAALDRPILDFFPEHADLATPERRRVTLRHVLTMTAGLEWNEEISYRDPRNDEIRMTRSPDPARYVLGRPLVAEPGARWTYSGGTTHLLAEVIQRRTGKRLLDVAREALFEPLGITDVEWLGDLGATPAAASGLRMRPRDLAKFASLYLHEGRWNGRQVIPAAWVAASTIWAVPIASGEWGERGYGYQWNQLRYRTPTGTVVAYVAQGNGHQRIFILPELRMAVTMLAGRYNDPTAGTLGYDLLMEHILPAVR